MQTIHEAVALLLVSVNILRGIPGQSVELLKIIHHVGVVLLQVEEFITLHLDQSGGNVSLTELGGEFRPVDDMIRSLHGLDILPPCSGGSREKVSGEKNFLVISYRGDFKVVFNGAEPIIRVEGSDTLGEHGRVGILKVPKA
jgi:hypothetical protein